MSFVPIFYNQKRERWPIARPRDGSLLRQGTLIGDFDRFQFARNMLYNFTTAP